MKPPRIDPGLRELIALALLAGGVVVLRWRRMTSYSPLFLPPCAQ
jgi:hypothetical protein